MEINKINLYGVEFEVVYDYFYDPGVYTYPNGDPGYPPSEELDIAKIIVGTTDITSVIYNTPSLFRVIEESIYNLEESKRLK